MLGIELTTDQMVVLGCLGMLGTSLFLLQCGWWIHQSRERQATSQKPIRQSHGDGTKQRDVDRITSA